MMQNVNYQWIRRFETVKPFFRGKSYLRVKRIMDLTLVCLSAPIWLPVILLTALVIFVTSPGAPVIYGSKRVGRGGKPFTFYKFRTMVPNANELKAKLMHLNELQWPDFKITNDPRVTPVG